MSAILEGPIAIGGDGTAHAQGHTLQEHLATFGSAPDRHDLLDRVHEAELLGHGGAFFPVARKWQTALTAGGRGIVVANGAESEPVSAKDAALLQVRTHLVLDGVTATARATGSTGAIIWLHRGARHSRVAVERALHERLASGVLDVPIQIVEGPDGYLSGESSAIVRALSGGPALPIVRGVPAAVRGVSDRPTVVHNVETLARVALVARGADLDSGHRLMTVATSGRRVVTEVPADRLLADLLTETHGTADLRAVLLGGYGGTWRSWSDVAARSVDTLQPAASAGIALGLPTDGCGLHLSAKILRYLAASSARQCGPCLFGLDELADVMDRVASGRGRRSDLDRLDRIAAQVAGRGGCHHPDGALRMLESALDVFAADLAMHRRGRRCTLRHDALVSLPEVA